jgi:hypothetical protein
MFIARCLDNGFERTDREGRTDPGGILDPPMLDPAHLPATLFSGGIPYMKDFFSVKEVRFGAKEARYRTK